MINAILKKEWIKLRDFLLLITLVLVGVLGYFWYQLEYQFSTIEPESMMWYKFVQLEQKPYESLFYLLGFFALFLAVVQFVSERVRNRVRILSHLPISFQKLLGVHFGVGLFFLFVFWFVTFVAVGVILSFYYPVPLLGTVLSDFLLYLVVIAFVYIGVSSLIIEKSKLLGGVKFAFMIGAIAFLLKPDFTKDFTKFYIFYSPTLQEFVYQKNHGDHKFEYLSKSGKVMNQKEYEANLPFVYWRDLEIQGKLPFIINGVSYDKAMIKEERLSLEFEKSLLQSSTLKLYPFFNPIKSEGMIKFPEEAIYFGDTRLELYDFDNKLLGEKSKELNLLAQKQGVSFPIQKVFGKSTNMKPYDLGYLFLDNTDQLFNIKKGDNITTLEKVNYPKNSKIAYIHISENNAKEVAGYMIDKNSNFYLMSWDFEFTKFPLAGFDYTKMRLQILSNPLEYLVRFDDEKSYHGVVFDKNYKKIDDIDLE